MGVISFQKIFGLYGLNHHIVEISGDVTDAGRTNKRQTREDRATQPMDAGWLSFAIDMLPFVCREAFSMLCEEMFFFD